MPRHTPSPSKEADLIFNRSIDLPNSISQTPNPHPPNKINF